MFEMTQKELKAQFDLACHYDVFVLDASKKVQEQRSYEDAYLYNEQLVCLNRGFNCDVYPLEECHFEEMDSVTIAMQAENLLVLAYTEGASKRDHPQYGHDIFRDHTAAYHVRGILECMGINWRERQWTAPQLFVKPLENGNILLTLTDNSEPIAVLEAGESDENDEGDANDWAFYLATHRIS